MITEEQRKILAQRFENFLNLNYNCDCNDVDCPNNLYEAQMLMEIIDETLNVDPDNNAVKN